MQPNKPKPFQSVPQRRSSRQTRSVRVVPGLSIYLQENANAVLQVVNSDVAGEQVVAELPTVVTQLGVYEIHKSKS
jgi:hypothetical protein